MGFERVKQVQGHIWTDDDDVLIGLIAGEEMSEQPIFSKVGTLIGPLK